MIAAALALAGCTVPVTGTATGAPKKSHPFCADLCFTLGGLAAQPCAGDGGRTNPGSCAEFLQKSTKVVNEFSIKATGSPRFPDQAFAREVAERHGRAVFDYQRKRCAAGPATTECAEAVAKAASAVKDLHEKLEFGT